MTKCHGFGSGTISLGDLQVSQAVNMEQTWRSGDGRLILYKPVKLPHGFHALGHHAYSPPQAEQQVVKGEEAASVGNGILFLVSEVELLEADSPAGTAEKSKVLSFPVDYNLVWTSTVSEENEQVSLWSPVPPTGYKAAGYVASRNKPGLEEVVCVREDLTTDCTISSSVWKSPSSSSLSSPSSSSVPCWIQGVLKNKLWRQRTNSFDLYLWQTRPLQVGVASQGISTGTFHCSTESSDFSGPISDIKTLRNVDFNLASCMPSMQQLQELVHRYAPIVVLHPDEAFFPSSVEWFFQNGALLYSQQDVSNPVRVNASDGSNLPIGGDNDGSFWLDLPSDSAAADSVRAGKLSTATAYLHVKPMYGGTVTDLQFWLYYPFNGAAMLKVGPLDIKLGKIGEHVSDWEHLTIRIDNLTGTLSQIYLGHHSGGTWFQPSDMEYDKNTGRPIVYVSKHGHACYGHPGVHLQGDDRIGILNETKPSSFTWDLSNNYQLISADYLGVEEPPWLQFMREWGPKLQYNTQKELEKVFKLLPKKVRRSIEDLLSKFPNELSGQEGPTGPKQKNFWTGDER